MTTMFKGRKEDQRLLTGTGQFTADWNLPGQVYAAFLRSDRAHADITGLDLTAAKASVGVVGIVTGTDLRAENLGTPPCYIQDKGRDGQKFITPPRDLLAVDRVRCVGEPIVMVVAESIASAQEAIDKISIDYRDLPGVVDVNEAIKDGAPQLYTQCPNNIAFDYEFGSEEATAKVFAAAPHVVAVTVNHTRVITSPIEPNACLVSWDEAASQFDIYRPTQGVNMAVGFTKAYFGAQSTYRFIAKDVGGSFGTRGTIYPEYIALMLGARKIGRPIKWVSTRSETMLSDYQGRSAVVDGELAFDNDGRFLAVRYTWKSDTGYYPMDVGALGAIHNFPKGAIGPYTIPAVHGRIVVCVTNTGLVCAYRGAGRPETATSLEQLVDAAAVKLGLDRFEIRKRNLIPRERFPYTTPNGVTYDSGDPPALVAIAQEKSDWNGFAARRKESAARGKLRGIGCSSYIEPSAGPFSQMEQTRIRFLDDGKIELDTISGPSGQGHETTWALVVSRALGIPYDDITVRNSQASSAGLTGQGTGAARSMVVYGNSLFAGSQEVVKKGRPLAGEHLEVAEQDLEFTDGAYRVKGTDLAVKLTDLAAKHKGALDTVGETKAVLCFPSGAHVVEIELDPETGAIEILKYLAVDDCGTLIVPTLVEGQLMGGILQGIGQVMGEKACYDGDGQLLTGTFMDYFMPRADLLPRITLIDRPVPSPTNALGVKGAGETGCSGGLTTTYSAIMDALRQVGVTQMDMPFTPGRVWQAIQEARVT